MRAEYRLYLFDPTARVRGQRVTTEIALCAETEADAAREADGLRNGGYAELWLGQHVARIFEPDATRARA